MQRNFKLTFYVFNQRNFVCADFSFFTNLALNMGFARIKSTLYYNMYSYSSRLKDILTPDLNELGKVVVASSSTNVQKCHYLHIDL